MAKFDKIAFAKIGDIHKVHTIVTDVKPSERWLEALDSLGVHLMYEKNVGGMKK